MIRTRRAQALVEMALVMPFLVTLLMITIEFGFYFYTMANVNNAVRLAARAGASSALTDAAVQGVVNRALGFQAAGATTTIYEFTSSSLEACDPALPPPSEDVAGHPRVNGNYLVVRISIPYSSFTRLVDLSVGGINQHTDFSTFPIFH